MMGKECKMLLLGQNFVHSHWTLNKKKRKKTYRIQKPLKTWNLILKTKGFHFWMQLYRPQTYK